MEITKIIKWSINKFSGLRKKETYDNQNGHKK